MFSIIRNPGPGHPATQTSTPLGVFYHLTDPHEVSAPLALVRLTYEDGDLTSRRTIKLNVTALISLCTFVNIRVIDVFDMLMPYIVWSRTYTLESGVLASSKMPLLSKRTLSKK